MKRNKGFTLIELMITVAIVGILAAVALPAYQSYIVRGQIMESLTVAATAKIFVNDFHTDKGAFPTNNADVGYPGAVGAYITNVEIQSNGAFGDVVTTFGNNANSLLTNKTLTLRATSNGTNLEWSCFSADIEPEYLPATCK